MNEFLLQCEEDLKDRFAELEEISFYNQKKILNAFKEHNVGLRHFYGSTGYGYDDVGKPLLNEIVAQIFDCEKAVLSPFITCGTHAINLALTAVLRPNDYLLSITGMPYDTVVPCILGEEGKDTGSLKDFGVKFDKIDLVDDKIDIENVVKKVKELNPKLVYMQRSRGYAWRKPISVDEIKVVVDRIREVNKDCFIFVDNCYGEFLEKIEPTAIGVDMCVGSCFKNMGGGIAPTGGYVAGTKRAIDLVEARMTCPSEGMEVGSYEAGYRLFYQGLFMAPSVVCNAVKGAYLVGRVMEKLGYEILPKSTERVYDIVKSIKFNNEEELIKFIQLVQSVSPVDGNSVPMPWEMPGYDDKVIMAAGTFVQGATMELSCDSPIRAPYVAYLQGGLSYEHLKILAEECLKAYGK